MTRDARRRLLVAAPELLDPNFERTVLFMVDHTPEGALGIVLNRPTQRRVDDVFPDWASLVSAPAVVFVGGPVSLGEAVIGIGRATAMDGRDPDGRAPDGWTALLGPVGTVDLAADPLDVSATVDDVRVFAGYAGWGPGQLDEELDHGGWHLVDARAGDLLTTDPSILWRSVLRRQGGELAMAANHPPDPGVN
jgi:putative transcriptional regulator